MNDIEGQGTAGVSTDPLVTTLSRLLGDWLVSIHGEGDEVTIEVQADRWHEVAQRLRDDEALRFEMAIDLCGLDFLGWGQTEWDTGDASFEGFSRGVEGDGPGRFNWERRPVPANIPNRFAVVLHLLSLTHNKRLRMRAYCEHNDVPTMRSLVDIWPGLNWFEREAFDLFGILFDGHPDLRRLLTDYGFVGHAFRKDFPLIGNVEMRYDEETRRIVYEPVSIEPRVLVPRVIRDNSGYLQARAESAQDAQAPFDLSAQKAP